MTDAEPETGVTLIAVNQTYWLFEGAEYLNQVLLGQGYPVPVKCVFFADSFEMKAYIGKDRVLTEFWGINPDIVERLRRDDHLLELPVPVT
jgi:hypothetical protein